MPTSQDKKIVQKIKLELDSLLDSLNGMTADDNDYKPTLKKIKEMQKVLKDYNPKNQTELRDWIPVIGSVSAITVLMLFEVYGHTSTNKLAQLFLPKTSR